MLTAVNHRSIVLVNLWNTSMSAWKRGGNRLEGKFLSWQTTIEPFVTNLAIVRSYNQA